MQRNDKVLFDIANATRLIILFLDGMDRAAFDTDPKTQSAVLHQLTILGEAAKQLPDTFRNQHPSIPWHQIGRMRDRLIHNYFNIDIDIVWHSATVDVPALHAYLLPLVTPLLSDDEIL